MTGVNRGRGIRPAKQAAQMGRSMKSCLDFCNMRTCSKRQDPE